MGLFDFVGDVVAAPFNLGKSAVDTGMSVVDKVAEPLGKAWGTVTNAMPGPLGDIANFAAHNATPWMKGLNVMRAGALGDAIAPHVPFGEEIAGAVRGIPLPTNPFGVQNVGEAENMHGRYYKPFYSGYSKATGKQDPVMSLADNISNRPVNKYSQGLKNNQMYNMAKPYASQAANSWLNKFFK